MKTRSVLVIVHRYVGLATAVFLIVVGLTGSVLSWRAPISEWLSPQLYAAPGRGAVLSPIALAMRARALDARADILDYPLHLEAGRGVRFDVAPRFDPATGRPWSLGYDAIWVDPVTGALLGRVNDAAFPPSRDTLVSFVYRLHYALAIPGQWGGWILGIVALLWFFDCFVGAVLTFPRGRPFLHKWRPMWRVKPRRLNYDLHRAGGLWPWALLATIALSSVYFNLNGIFMPMFGLVADVSHEPFETRPIRPPDTNRQSAIGPERAIDIANATALGLGWHATPGNMSRRATQGFWQVYFDAPPTQWARPGNYALFIDDESGAVIFVRSPGGTRGDVFLSWLSALHVGGVFGWPYKVLLSALGVMTAGLSITGLIIWWRKRFRRHRTKSSPSVSYVRVTSSP